MSDSQQFLNDQLFHAAKYSDEHECVRLIERGADIHAIDDGTSWSLLHWATSKNSLSVSRALLERGADVNTKDFHLLSVLHIAAYEGRMDHCLMLLEHGCDPLAQDSQRRTAMDLAVSKDHKDCAAVIQSFVAAQAARAALRHIASDSAFKETSP